MVKKSKNKELIEKLNKVTVTVKPKRDLEWELLKEELKRYSFEDIEYLMRKTDDCVTDVFESLNEKFEEIDCTIKAIKKKIREEKKVKTFI